MRLSKTRPPRNLQRDQDPGEALSNLSGRIRRLCPDHRDPHRFHEEKSEIAFELTTLAERIAK